jgi:DNA-binding GntR family transcriptional regulator
VEQLLSLPLSEQLREHIEERIVNGRYAPGTKLDEAELAASFHVSRTPIREALIQLSAAGLVESRPRRGSIVAEVSPTRLAEMFDFMAELEAACARRAALLATEEEIAKLDAAHEACRPAFEANDPDRYYRRNEQFHRTLYAISHNAFLAEQSAMMQRRLQAYRRLQLRVPHRIAASFSEHVGVVEAIRARDPDLATDRIKAHVTVQNSQFMSLSL